MTKKTLLVKKMTINGQDVPVIMGIARPVAISDATKPSYHEWLKERELRRAARYMQFITNYAAFLCCSVDEAKTRIGELVAPEMHQERP